ncbi:MAG TPA: short-chain fatty acyl-CoA regulator family protein [Thermoanaerobaculia bacterium]|nr:short-chain fatty acyl-CoA regulator family protein [Thermoanaerobaculia bacterium]
MPSTTSTPRLGTKVRSLRRKQGLTQTELASRLEISPSYLNLIEHNQRPLPGHLLVRLAGVLGADLAAFADDTQARLAADLQEIFGDPLFQEHPLTTNDLREVAENPAAARAVIALYHAYRASADSTRALASKLYDGRDFLGLNPAHLPAEEVSDVIQANMNYFPELEGEAERVAAAARLDRADMHRSLSLFLRDRHGIEVILTPVSRDRSAVRRYDPERRTLSLSEVLPPWSRNFQLAHQIGLVDAGETIDAITARSEKHLTAPESVRLCRVALANYFAAALLMPYDEFLRTTEEVRYDIELLQHHYTASWEQVCHRLTTMRKAGASGVPFHFVRVDIAGNISKRFSGTGIRFARFSGSCPRWDVHAAFLTPGRIRTQLSKMPDGTAYFCVARTIRKSFGYAAGDALMGVGIGCPVGEARKLVYADGYDLDNLDAAVPIGTTCRLCERMDCEQRAFPALQTGISIDENVRGRSFYAPAE